MLRLDNVHANHIARGEFTCAMMEAVAKQLLAKAGLTEVKVTGEPTACTFGQGNVMFGFEIDGEFDYVINVDRYTTKDGYVSGHMYARVEGKHSQAPGRIEATFEGGEWFSRALEWMVADVRRMDTELLLWDSYLDVKSDGSFVVEKYHA